MTDIIVISILVLAIGGAVAYIINAKKSGAKCIGCPVAGNCPGKGGGKNTCACGCQSDTK